MRVTELVGIAYRARPQWALLVTAPEQGQHPMSKHTNTDGVQVLGCFVVVGLQHVCDLL